MSATATVLLLPEPPLPPPAAALPRSSKSKLKRRWNCKATSLLHDPRPHPLFSSSCRLKFFFPTFPSSISLKLTHQLSLSSSTTTTSGSGGSLIVLASSSSGASSPELDPYHDAATAATDASASASSASPPASEPPPPVSVINPSQNTRDRRKKVVRQAWEKLVRWSRSWRSRNNNNNNNFDVLHRTNKVVVLGGGSFGTAMATHVAARKPDLQVHMLLRDPLLCHSVNHQHCNCKYFPHHKLPHNVIASTDAKAALLAADYCLHAVPVQFSTSFLKGIAEYVDPGLPFISLSKGLELNTLRMMSQIIPQALRNPRQPFVALSGPSFALELMNKLPTAMVVASKDKKLANAAQQLLASPHLRISTSSDVTGVEIAGALKNVLAIAAGIVEGMNLGNNSMAALVAQGCSEIRWLATKMGAKPATVTGLSGTGDIMLTCFINLSRNRTVGVRLGSGEKLDDILSSMNQVAEGVSTAGAVIALAQKYNVKMPVLTAVARIIDNELTPKKAVLELMSLPQVEEV